MKLKTDEEILQDFSTTRHLSKHSVYTYRTSIKHYTDFNKKSLHELLVEALEDETGTAWKDCKLKKRLIAYRNYLKDTYLESSVNAHFNQILTIYRHYEVAIHPLPYTSRVNVNESTPIGFKDLPDQKIIKEALKISSVLMRAIILFMSSSGCARRETLNLTIQDFIDATKEYHNSNNIYDVITALKGVDVIPEWEIRRQKTNKYYCTFSSPESTAEIINYLITIKKTIKNTDKLFRINSDYFARNFKEINNKLKLGKRGTYNRFRSHMLRKFHASQLYNDGLSLEEVDALQGRTKNRTHQSYFMEDPKNLKEKYIQHLDCLTINLDVNNLDIKSPEYTKLETENVKLKKQYYETNKRMDNLEKIVLGNISDDKLARLHKLL